MEAEPEEWQESPEDPSPPSETYLVGFVIANIVGLQYYSGTISGREMVGLVREPLNPYDSNAIRVFNTRLLQVGHVERSVAKALAPLLDSGEISAAEGIVPKKRSRFENRFRIPCQIHLFASRESFSAVRSAISRAGLALISDGEASFGISESAAVEERKSSGERTVDSVFKLVEESLRREGAMEKMNPPKETIVAELFEHQREGLWWLWTRENSGDLPPFWAEEKDGFFANSLTNYRTETRPEPLRGGVFADDMGLGKTLTLLSLIALDNAPSPTENPRKKRKRLKKTTLVVCPSSVLSSWVDQLASHTRPGSLKVYMYHGAERSDDVDELGRYDVVLTTYGTVAAEGSVAAREMEWWRVVLDEAHVVKNAKAAQSRAVRELKADRRWVVTGTPVQNGSLDLYSLMAFLRFEPFSVKSYWQSLVQRPISQGNKKGLNRLQVLMATISLRRTKDKALVGLPQKTIETCYVELSREERELYDEMESAAKEFVRGYIEAGSPTSNFTTVLSTILRLRQICTHTALCPPDLRSLFPSNNLEDVSNKPELLQKIVEVLQDGEDFDCPICISSPTDMVITLCGHIYCRNCIMKTLKHSKSICPLCRAPLSTSDLFSAPPPSSNPDHEEPSSSSSSSSKISALLKLLSESRDQNPTANSVVFSQFTKMLKLLEAPLREAGFETLRLDGSMSAKKRGQVIKEFGLGSGSEKGSVSKPRVLLASLKASGTGINLAAASRVYLFEPWWNPAVEEQAMDRVHRIGQREEVKVVRLIARDTVEERVLKLQEKKKKLADETFGRRERGSKSRRDIGIDDLRTLMSM